MRPPTGRVIKKNGIFGSVEKPKGKVKNKICIILKPIFLRYTIFSFRKVVSCAAFTPNGDLLTGDSNGTIIGWTKDSNQSSFCITNVHKG